MTRDKTGKWQDNHKIHCKRTTRHDKTTTRQEMARQDNYKTTTRQLQDNYKTRNDKTRHETTRPDKMLTDRQKNISRQADRQTGKDQATLDQCRSYRTSHMSDSIMLGKALRQRHDKTITGQARQIGIHTNRKMDGRTDRLTDRQQQTRPDQTSAGHM
jgi:hypothetical protein